MVEVVIEWAVEVCEKSKWWRVMIGREENVGGEVVIFGTISKGQNLLYFGTGDCMTYCYFFVVCKGLVWFFLHHMIILFHDRFYQCTYNLISKLKK